MSGSATPIDPGARIGHVHLRVTNLERAIEFYAGVLGFQLTQRYGPQAAFLSAGGYHHHIGLNTWESESGPAAPRNTAGLYHLAILYPTRAALARALLRVLRAGIELDGAADHGVSLALAEPAWEELDPHAALGRDAAAQARPPRDGGAGLLHRGGRPRRRFYPTHF